MTINVYEAQMMRQERIKDSMRKARQQQLGQLERPLTSRVLDQALASVGGVMISAGKKLQARHAPAKTLLTRSPSPASQ
jgi:hypothetical protein